MGNANQKFLDRTRKQQARKQDAIEFTQRMHARNPEASRRHREQQEKELQAALARRRRMARLLKGTGRNKAKPHHQAADQLREQERAQAIVRAEELRNELAHRLRRARPFPPHMRRAHKKPVIETQISSELVLEEFDAHEDGAAGGSPAPELKRTGKMFFIDDAILEELKREAKENLPIRPADIVDSESDSDSDSDSIPEDTTDDFEAFSKGHDGSTAKYPASTAISPEKAAQYSPEKPSVGDTSPLFKKREKKKVKRALQRSTQGNPDVYYLVALQYPENERSETHWKYITIKTTLLEERNFGWDAHSILTIHDAMKTQLGLLEKNWGNLLIYEDNQAIPFTGFDADSWSVLVQLAEEKIVPTSSIGCCPCPK